MKIINIINKNGEVYYNSEEGKGVIEGYQEGFPEGKEFLNVQEGTCGDNMPFTEECQAYVDNILSSINE